VTNGVDGRCATSCALLALLLGLLAASASPAAAQPRQPEASQLVGPIWGTLRRVSFFSHALMREVPYFVYLPPGYGVGDRLYATLYMLHGNSGSNEEWIAYGLIDEVDGMIMDGQIRPVIVVLPQGDFSYWVNLPPMGPNYGDYLLNDLVEHIDATYRVREEPQYRAVGGLSMGGTGALIAAFRNPEVFGVVGAHSPALPEEGQRFFLGMGRDFGQRDPITQAMRREQLEELTIWIDVGDEDDWLARAEELHAILDEREILHEWLVFPGEHWGGYWGEHIPDYLRFYDAALHSAVDEPLGVPAEPTTRP
jgi:enterochelin esterase-like enzyme